MSEKICRLCGSKPGSVCVQSFMLAKKGSRWYDFTPTMKYGMDACCLSYRGNIVEGPLGAD